MIFEYVLSGLSFTNIHVNHVSENKDIAASLGMLYQHAQTCSEHDISVLFNAYQEPRLAKPINTILKPNIHSVFCDSGGLQVISKGKQFDSAMKRKVYTLQALYSDCAMAFDEIPIESTLQQNYVKTSTDAKSRVFLAHQFDSFVQKTKNNLLEQCEIFLEKNAKAKIFPIIQGNCLDTYQEWYSGILTDLPPEFKNLIGGISFSTAALGYGVLENIELVVIIENLVKEFDHVHFLGFGSITRLLPILILQHSGFLKNINRISYDSTTHTGMVSRGDFFVNESQKIYVGRHIPSKNVSLVLETIFNYFEPCLKEIESQFGFSLTEEELFYHICSTKHIDAFKKYSHKHYNAITLLSFILAQILNFTNIVDQFRTNKSALEEYVAKKEPLLMSLFNVKTTDDFFEWKKTIQYIIPTQRVVCKQHNSLSLENFF